MEFMQNQRRYRRRRGHIGGHESERNPGLYTLDLLPPGKKCIIRSVGGEGFLRRRLLDMGLTPNTEVLVRKVAPLGDPIELFLRNYELTIRKDDAKKIIIEEVSE